MFKFSLILAIYNIDVRIGYTKNVSQFTLWLKGTLFVDCPSKFYRAAANTFILLRFNFTDYL